MVERIYLQGRLDWNTVVSHHATDEERADPAQHREGHLVCVVAVTLRVLQVTGFTWRHRIQRKHHTASSAGSTRTLGEKLARCNERVRHLLIQRPVSPCPTYAANGQRFKAKGGSCGREKGRTWLEPKGERYAGLVSCLRYNSARETGGRSSPNKTHQVTPRFSQLFST